MNLKKMIWVMIGLASLGLGYAGIFIPGLPTTVFVIVALWAFSRSSVRLHSWLRSIPVFAQAVEQADHYHKHKTISKRVKLIAQTFAWSSVVLILLTLGISWSLLFVFLAALSCSIFMLKTKTK